jgi:coniferyl-aldehyde dehydrogenase
MVKPSELTPETSDLLHELVKAKFDETELVVIVGGADVAATFAGLPFDHLIFTGSTGVGRHVLRAAAENLVPTTLELGGKSPVLIGASANMVRACERVITGKLLNAGQICLAPDYILVQESREQEVIAGLEAAVSTMYPTQVANEDYTSIINRRHRERLGSLVDDARRKGATIKVLNPANESFADAGNKMPLHLIYEVDDSMRVTQEEIFGPILPIVTYESIEEAIDYVNRRPRPLALYYFGESQGEERKVLDCTISGGVTVNDVIFHAAADDLPFGGVGPSGMGAYHGFDGFTTFSHAKGIYRQPRLDIAKLAGFKPPYGEKTRKALDREIG